jgi:hypothetical protein
VPLSLNPSPYRPRPLSSLAGIAMNSMTNPDLCCHPFAVHPHGDALLGHLDQLDAGADTDSP